MRECCTSRLLILLIRFLCRDFGNNVRSVQIVEILFWLILHLLVWMPTRIVFVGNQKIKSVAYHFALVFLPHISFWPSKPDFFDIDFETAEGAVGSDSSLVWETVQALGKVGNTSGKPFPLSLFFCMILFNSDLQKLWISPNCMRWTPTSIQVGTTPTRRSLFTICGQIIMWLSPSRLIGRGADRGESECQSYPVIAEEKKKKNGTYFRYSAKILLFQSAYFYRTPNSCLCVKTSSNRRFLLKGTEIILLFDLDIPLQSWIQSQPLHGGSWQFATISSAYLERDTCLIVATEAASPALWSGSHIFATCYFLYPVSFDLILAHFSDCCRSSPSDKKLKLIAQPNISDSFG